MSKTGEKDLGFLRSGKRKFDASGRKPVLCLGDVIELGMHRLMCGDSAKSESIAKVLAGDKVDTLVYDPEWDQMVAVDIDCADKLVMVNNLCMSFAFDLFSFPAMIFVWTGGSKSIAVNFNPHMPQISARFCFWYGDPSKYRNNYRWVDPRDKRKAVVKKKVARGHHGLGVCINEVGNPPRLSDSFIMSGKDSGLHWHSHAKPLPWVKSLLANCTKGLVLDPFGGSGATLIACEQLSRPCRMIEYDPSTCEMIITRYLQEVKRGPDIVLNGTNVNWAKIRNPMIKYEEPDVGIILLQK